MNPPNTNNEHVPEWMKPLGIKEGEWFSMPKRPMRSQMRPGNPLCVQIWACGMLHTAGYKGELAKTKRNGEVVLLTAGDIVREILEEAETFFKPVSKDKKTISKFKISKENMRKGMENLENKGLMERRVNGKPLRELPPKERQRLAGKGQVELWFWGEPHPANIQLIKDQWDRELSQVNTQVVNGGLLRGFPDVLSINQILKTFVVDKATIAKIGSHPNHDLIITEALEVSKFKDCQAKFNEVVTRRLLEVVPPDLPEVVPPGGAIEEKKVESELLKKGAGGLVGSLTVEAPPVQQVPASQPAATAHQNPTEEITEGLIARGFDPVPSIIEKIRLTLKDAPVSGFFAFLDERRGRGTAVGRGLLPAIAQEYMQTRQVAATVTAHPIPPVRAKSAIDRAKELLKKRLEDKEKKYA
jgi:hypothetical protein